MEQQYDKKLLREIAHQLREGTVSDEQQAYFDQWYVQHEDELLELPEGYAEDSLVIRDRMHSNLMDAVKLAEAPSKKAFILWTKFIAAAVFLVVIGTVFYVNRRNFLSTSVPVSQLADVVAGSNKAILTLADGKKITLTDVSKGKISEQAGVQISKTRGGQVIYQVVGQQNNASNSYNTIETPNGGQYQVILPDGTKVWLNAASKLTYPVSFTGRARREVTLGGEAYFEVAKDKSHPFLVESSGQEVEVLGTHFNISSYKEEPHTKTTLLEGSVKIRSAKGNAVVLKPNQQAELNGDHLQVKEVKAAYAVAWKDGYFMFNNENLETVMTRIARWYNVQVEFKDEAAKGGTYFGTISRYEDIAKVLKMLSRTELVTFELEGNTIKINKKK
ncbi:FecR family protein [Pedobacter nutrimenti]|uniref:FecR family protein n=1 Tax=Pedobacter nutrimenti TaxID=1241337 RepID=UPI0029314CAB|nr:FecR domain-containing protein [Pedobacter nutrimenti]